MTYSFLFLMLASADTAMTNLIVPLNRPSTTGLSCAVSSTEDMQGTFWNDFKAMATSVSAIQALAEWVDDTGVGYARIVATLLPSLAPSLFWHL
jgi:hypothetical protein